MSGSGRLLAVEDLTVAFGPTKAVDRISFTLDAGETLGLVGESGCGKSTTAMALIRLLQGAETGGHAWFEGVDLVAVAEERMREIRGGAIGMIFQDPATALHPMIRVGDQVAETLRTHRRLGAKAARARTIELFRQVGVAAPEERLSVYPHEMSGGMCQRVIIAMAIACSPRLLLADEPTTALDVTVQAQILELLHSIARDGAMSMILITHDLGVVAGVTNRVAVMYAGVIVETAPTDRLFADPKHPYTQGLLRSIPRLDSGWDEDMPTIAGAVHDAHALPGCRFAPRCPLAAEVCREAPPLRSFGADHQAACWRAS
ncbi:MAG TPA: ABC transporter ATP-binding protein [Roseiarcus sp.]|jgi:peptide/nickel transport system ATP-binding protein